MSMPPQLLRKRTLHTSATAVSPIKVAILFFLLLTTFYQLLYGHLEASINCVLRIQMITFELHDLSSRYLICMFILQQIV